MTPEPRLAAQASWYALRASLWRLTADAACRVALRCFSNARTAAGDAEIVMARAGGDQRHLHPSEWKPEP